MSSPSPDVTFAAELVALGDAESIDLHGLQYEDTALLIFVAPVEEVRKAAGLYRRAALLGSIPKPEPKAIELARSVMVLLEWSFASSPADSVLVDACPPPSRARIEEIRRLATELLKEVGP